MAETTAPPAGPPAAPPQEEATPQIDTSRRPSTPLLIEAQKLLPPPPPLPEAVKGPALEAPAPAPVTQKVAGLLTILCFVLSLPVLAAGISLLYMRDYDCEDLLRMPHARVAIGVGMMVVFVASSLAVYYGPRCLLPAFLAVMVLLMIMFIIGLALVGAYTIESRAVPGSPMWLKLRIARDAYWNDVKTCLYRTNICAELGYRMMGLSSYEFTRQKLSKIESGCCKPPLICGMEYVNATCWINTRRSVEYDELQYASYSLVGGDCSTWNNAQNELCYDCHACREGFLKTLQKRWRRLGIFLTVMGVLLITVHVLIFVANVIEKHRS